MSVGTFILCAFAVWAFFAVWALFRFADGLESVARSVKALAKAVGDED